VGGKEKAGCQSDEEAEGEFVHAEFRCVKALHARDAQHIIIKSGKCA
jgi:hypothetical protein